MESVAMDLEQKLGGCGGSVAVCARPRSSPEECGQSVVKRWFIYCCWLDVDLKDSGARAGVNSTERSPCYPVVWTLASLKGGAACLRSATRGAAHDPARVPGRVRCRNPWSERLAPGGLRCCFQSLPGGMCYSLGMWRMKEYAVGWTRSLHGFGGLRCPVGAPLVLNLSPAHLGQKSTVGGRGGQAGLPAPRWPATGQQHRPALVPGPLKPSPSVLPEHPALLFQL